MSTPPLRLVRLAPDPLGLYIRAGRIDQKELQSFITSGAAAFTGVVFEAKRVVAQRELLSLNAALVAAKLSLPDDLALKAARQAKRLNDLRTTLGP